MMKNLLMMICLAATLAACGSDDDDDFAPQPVERTVIVYMSGENSLTSYVNGDLNEMKEGSRLIGAGNALVVFVDKSLKKELPWLARIRDGQVTDSVSISDMGIGDEEALSSDPHVFEDVLQNLPHFKFIFADCCNFMCLESLYELRNVADYIIGSPAEIPAEGAPYSKMLPAMFLQDDDFYTAIVDRCYEQKAKGLYLPLSVVRTSEMEHVAQATRTALTIINDGLGDGYADMTGLIYYYYDGNHVGYDPMYNIFYDAGDFMLHHAPESVYRQWKEVLDRAVVYRRMSTHWDTNKRWNNYYGNNFTVTEERYHGVSMFVPQSPFGGYYSFYNRNIRQFAWYYAVNDKAGGM